ncbi:TetR/AcrR family transcriptional regulator [Marinicella rhabdoformis]|uniref:TetR/AcrR family transcriptional regulator n=1 Tax=Marinicella rhabdoformis TaxID=2580566 RepID=UPI0012AEBEB9|nr:TetR/AcrR family transcriptional regulator [Marinicella rhabdoformis]
MGRVITFDKEHVFDICLRAFWKHGYDNTSIRELQRLTGLSGRSLIHSFGDKRQIFDSCLAHYLLFVRQLTQNLADDPKGLEVFFEGFTVCDSADIRHNGCFVLNSIFGDLKGDQQIIVAFEGFKVTVTDFFKVQLSMNGIKGASEKAEMLFDLFLSGLTKISIYADAAQMTKAYKAIKRLVADWSL